MKSVSFSSFARGLQKWRAFASAVLVVLALAPNATALTVVGNFIGGTQQGPSVGGGNIVSIFNAAAATWQNAILDNFTVHIDYGWGASPGGVHFLQSQGGNPNRETSGLILVQPQIFNDGSFGTMFMDPTPLLNEEFTAGTVMMQNFGGGPMSIARILTANSLAPGGLWMDCYTIVLHEIGHALGLSNANTSFIIEAGDVQIQVGAGLPHAGSVLPIATNNFGPTSHLNISGTLMAGLGFNDRRLPTAADILANAQISGFTSLNLSPLQQVQGVPEEGSSAILLLIALSGLFTALRRRRT